MTPTIKPGELLPDALAVRLAGHYAANATCVLALLYWTGQVLPGTSVEVSNILRPERDAKGNRDPQAVMAELRALEHYCKVHDGRPEVADWRNHSRGGDSTSWWDDFDKTVPWAWREVAT